MPPTTELPPRRCPLLLLLRRRIATAEIDPERQPLFAKRHVLRYRGIVAPAIYNIQVREIILAGAHHQYLSHLRQGNRR